MATSRAKLLAIYLHDKFCVADHNDKCGWHWEVNGMKHNWSGIEHSHWLRASNQLINKLKEIGLVKRGWVNISDEKPARYRTLAWKKKDNTIIYGYLNDFDDVIFDYDRNSVDIIELVSWKKRE